MNKVISFSLYGSDDIYCIGMLENIEIINRDFSDWKIYIFYHNIPESLLEELKKKPNTYLFPCQHRGTKWEGMFWRFYPMENMNIDVFLSRDADSRISQREMNLVNDFLHSNKTFHIIRDHPKHDLLVLGGTFGMKVKEFHKVIKKKRVKFYPINYFLNHFHNTVEEGKDKGPDQDFLIGYIFPIIHDNNMTHCSYKNLIFRPTDILIPPDDNYIGKIVSPHSSL
jgi:hypothetical protein